MDFNKPFRYEPNSGKWSLELQKAPKDVFAQCGVKITIDSGIPNGEEGPCYQTKVPCGLSGATVEIRCFDNLSSWTSVVVFDLPTLLEKLVEIMPKDKVMTDTFVLSKRDVERVVKGDKKNG